MRLTYAELENNTWNKGHVKIWRQYTRKRAVLRAFVRATNALHLRSTLYVAEVKECLF